MSDGITDDERMKQAAIERYAKKCELEIAAMKEVLMNAEEQKGNMRCLSSGLGAAICIWDWDRLPKEIKEWIAEQEIDSSDCDWIEVVTPEYKDQYISWLDEPSFGCCAVKTYELSPQGYTLVMGYHA